MSSKCGTPHLEMAEIALNFSRPSDTETDDLSAYGRGNDGQCVRYLNEIKWACFRSDNIVA